LREAVAQANVRLLSRSVQYIRELEDKNERLAAALKTCADELSYYVEAEYPPEWRKYPSQQAKYEGDMQAVIDARAALREAGVQS